MPRYIILLTGTPCVGKTSVARQLTSRLNAVYVNLTELAKSENLILGRDKKRESTIVDETRMQNKVQETIKRNEQHDIIIDGHYAVNVAPRELVTHVFVLRRNPVELRKLMEKAGFSGRKLWENLASEILDVCLVDALSIYEEEKVCELDTTGKSAEATAEEILCIVNEHKKCQVGIVDWLGKLESEGILDEYLRI